MLSDTNFSMSKKTALLIGFLSSLCSSANSADINSLNQKSQATVTSSIEFKSSIEVPRGWFKSEDGWYVDYGAIAGGDMDGDGANEIVVAHHQRAYVDYVFFNPNPKKRSLNWAKKQPWNSFIGIYSQDEDDGTIYYRYDIKIEGDGYIPCVHPNGVRLADLNSDGVLDVAIACHGIDFGTPKPGEKSLVLLSQGRNSYSISELPIEPTFSHSLTLEDADFDGDVDIFLADATFKKGQRGGVYLLKNNGDGSFQKAEKIIKEAKEPIYSVGAADLNNDGYFDLIVGGHEYRKSKPGLKTRIYWNDGKSNFSKGRSSLVPEVKDYGVPLEYLLWDNFLYVYRAESKRFHKSFAIQQINLDTLETKDVISGGKHSIASFQRLKDNQGRIVFGNYSALGVGVEIDTDNNITPHIYDGDY